MRTRTQSSPMVVAGENHLAYRPTSQSTMNPSNHNGRQNVDTTERAAELAQLIRSAMNYSARQLLAELPPSQRTESESMKLKDMARDRAAVTDANLAFVMVLQDRLEAHYLTDNLRGVEVQAGRSPLCVFSASETEQQHDAELDMAQLLFARERSKTRAEQLIATGQKHLHAIRRLVDAAHSWMARTA